MNLLLYCIVCSCNSRPDQNAAEASTAEVFFQGSHGLRPSGELLTNSAGYCPEIQNAMKEISIVFVNFLHSCN